MDEEIRNALADEILNEFGNLKNFETGSKEQQGIIENITKLYELKMKEAKADADWNETCDRREKENREEQFREKQSMEQTKERWFKLGVDVAGIILPLMFYAVWMGKGFRFEETGTYTSTTFRGLFNRFKPTEK